MADRIYLLALYRVITNDVSDSSQQTYVIAYIICNHPELFSMRIVRASQQGIENIDTGLVFVVSDPRESHSLL
jgi:hypothetical protein